MSAILDYKCPNCGGAINFDAASGQFKCASCDSTFAKEDLDKYAKMLDLANEKSEYSWESAGTKEPLDGVNSYICNSCGAELVLEETAAASECPYCGSPVVLAGQLSGMNKPDCVIPFCLTKDNAKESLKGFYKGKYLLPKEFKDENRLKEIQGIYVPFWLFDCDADANIVYDATTTRSWSDSSYNYTETKHYDVFRSGSLGFHDIPTDGSTKMDDAYMEGLEPFIYDSMQPFDPAYLSGFAADKYDVDATASFPRAEKRVETSTAEAFADTVQGYETVTMKNTSIKTTNGSYKYALFPVWMLTSKYKDKSYTFAINGQTGKVSGELPINKLKLRLTKGATFLVSMGILQLILFWLGIIG